MPAGRRPLITTWKLIEMFPPPHCRLLARNPGLIQSTIAVTDTELAIRSGIPLSRIREISYMESWENVPVGEMRRFFEACNFDPTNAVHRDRVTRYENRCQKTKSTPFNHLRRNPKWETEFLPLQILVSKIMKSRDESQPKIRPDSLVRR